MVMNECQECHIVGRDSPFEGEIFVRGDEHCVISGRGAFRTQWKIYDVEKVNSFFSY